MSYDLMVRYIKQPIAQDESILLIDIDDHTMNMDFVPYSWPWPRYMHGDALEVLADFGTKAVVFDIEFLGNSVAGVNLEQALQMRDLFNRQFQAIQADFEKASALIVSNQNMRQDLSPLQKGFQAQLDSYLKQINRNFDQVIEDNDQYFSKRIRYHGRVYGTVNMLAAQTDESQFQQVKKTAEQKAISKYGLDLSGIWPDYKKYPVIIAQTTAEFPQSTILSQYKGVGFTSVDRDKDGSIRYISLFREKEGYLFPQLALKPFFDLFQISPDQIDVTQKNWVIIKNVMINEKKRDIRIPLVNQKYMYINWPHGTYEQIFIHKDQPTHFSYADLLNYKYTVLKKFEKNLANLARFGVETPEYQFYQTYQAFMQSKKQLVENQLLTHELRAQINVFLNTYLEQLLDFCSRENRARKQAQIDQLLESGRLNDSQIEEWQKIKADLRIIYEAVTDSVLMVQKARRELEAKLNGKICFIGLTATGTTDISPTPFDKNFKNLGTHPAVLNTIIQQDFIYMPGDQWGFLGAIILFNLMIWILLGSKKDLFSALMGFLTIFVVLFCLLLIFRLSNCFISPIIPVTYGFVSFLLMLFLKYFLNEQEKSLIRNTFNRYLSPIVINELLSDPNKIVLGGEKRVCTAIFTDIEGFSTISEQFMDSPEDLVNLLNNYLSVMSDIILEHKGIIDKYEGDAIIGFFGAPGILVQENHALDACLSSINMKKREDELNQYLIARGMSKQALKTRIGINTGEMVVGNLGTEKRLDYSMIGHTVNLASRLEGVNKIYGTYQLMSEFTYQLVKDQLLARKLDRVRVVNIKTPVRLYEIIGLKEQIEPRLLEALKNFESALDAFEMRKWRDALALFNQARYNEDFDRTINLYGERCRNFRKKPPSSDWDGIYNLTEK